MKQEEEKCCGNCCWFYANDNRGLGACPFLFGWVVACERSCVVKEKFASKKEMRHHMAVLLQYHLADEDMNHRFPGGEALEDAVVFAYKYMKVFSEL